VALSTPGLTFDFLEWKIIVSSFVFLLAADERGLDADNKAQEAQNQIGLFCLCLLRLFVAALVLSS
jgi:hypothetical protein